MSLHDTLHNVLQEARDAVENPAVKAAINDDLHALQTAAQQDLQTAEAQALKLISGLYGHKTSGTGPAETAAPAAGTQPEPAAPPPSDAGSGEA